MFEKGDEKHMHAHSRYTIWIEGEATDLGNVASILEECFQEEDVIIPEPVARVSDFSLEIIIEKTYEIVWLKDIVDLAEKMAEVAKNTTFIIDGIIDTSESAGEYMDFRIDYEASVLTVKSSVWYTIIGEDISYEEFCEWHDEAPDEHIYSLEEFESGSYYLERGNGEIVSEVPLDEVEIIDLGYEGDNTKNAQNENVSKKDVYETIRKLRKEDLPKEEIEQFLLNIPWTNYSDVVMEMLNGLSVRERYECIHEGATYESEQKFWETEDISKSNIRITKYTGSQTVVIVPEKVGEKTVTEIGDYAFSTEQPRISKELKTNRNLITKVFINDSVKKIGKGVFKKLENLEVVVLSKNLISIPDEAFMECKRLKHVVIPETVTRIGGRVFAGCNSLLFAYLPDSIKRARWFDQPIWPDAVTTFVGCSSLKKAKMPKEIKGLFSHEFGGCKELEEVILPGELKKIDSETFVGCSQLSNVDMPEGLERIGYRAFADCRKLNDIQIPSSVIKIDKETFDGIKGITLHVKEGSPIIGFAEKNKLSYVID